MEQHNLNNIVYILDYYSDFTNPPFEIYMGIENELDNSIYQYEGIKYKICEIKTYFNNRLNKELKKKLGLDNSNSKLENQIMAVIGNDFTTIKNYYIKYAQLNNSIIVEILNPKILNLKKQYDILSNHIHNVNNTNINSFLRSDIYQYFFLILSSLNELINHFNLEQIKVEEIIETNPHPAIFENGVFEIFSKWIEVSTDDNNKKISFVFQQLKKDNLLRKSNFKELLNWTKENNFISEIDYIEMLEIGHFVSPSKILSKGRTKEYQTMLKNHFPNFGKNTP